MFPPEEGIWSSRLLFQSGYYHYEPSQVAFHSPKDGALKIENVSGGLTPDDLPVERGCQRDNCCRTMASPQETTTQFLSDRS
jgi:hypothetical protein